MIIYDILTQNSAFYFSRHKYNFILRERVDAYKIKNLFSNYTVSKSAARLHFQSRRQNPSKGSKASEPLPNASVPKSKSTSGLHVTQNNSYIQRIQINRSIPNANNNLPQKRMSLARSEALHSASLSSNVRFLRHYCNCYKLF